ncbi:translation initiation factor eIF-2B subunit beta [Patellaria atrata CBS 101060]|uniref:Translation initiation factor eIF2B subunit beta n=1 Tax=Patellaria atrata CBS 101060 TaxID=1346257 RepID=A0A9P4SF26_9PEZI|nr:translation initiation factor eIF-2B subunit beta [Patellaria atrata CBS 101060]
MPSQAGVITPGLPSFLRSLKANPVETSIENLISLLKRRQIQNSRSCAIATTQLFLRVVGEFRGRDVEKLLQRVKDVGRRLTAAQPREMAVGNIVRRVLDLVREVSEGGSEGETNMSESDTNAANNGPKDTTHRPPLASSISTFSPLKHGAVQPLDHNLTFDGTGDSPDQTQRPPLLTSHTSYAASAAAPLVTSLFGLFQNPDTPSPSSTPVGYSSPNSKPTLTAQSLAGLGDAVSEKLDIKAEVLEGIRDLLEELDQVDERIAAYALEHIHTNEIILTHTASTTVHRFLLAAAKKRKFTVIHTESYPNDHKATHATILDGKKNGDDPDPDEVFKPLTTAGITVILIPDSAVFAIMSRVNKVILATHTVLANGGLVAASGAKTIAKAAKVHQTPVIVVSGVYKLSPVYPFDIDELIEYGDPGNVVPYEEGEFVEKVEVVNPLYDYVPPDLVDLYITDTGGHAPSYLYRIVADHYRMEDVNL